MKKLFILFMFIGGMCKAQTPTPINQYPSDSIVNISFDQLLINQYIQPGRYQLHKILPVNLFACDSVKENKLLAGQDSIRMTINRDTIKTTLADSLNDYIFLTAYVTSASLYVSAIHTGHYFVVKSTAWSKNNLFNWVIKHK